MSMECVYTCGLSFMNNSLVLGVCTWMEVLFYVGNITHLGGGGVWVTTVGLGQGKL